MAENTSFDNLWRIKLSAAQPWPSALLLTFFNRDVSLLPLLPHVHIPMSCPANTQRIRKVRGIFFPSPLSLFHTRLLQRCPWVRDILCLLLTSLMIGKVLKSDSAHLFPPLRRCKGSTSLTSLPSGIDHLMILKYSQHPHNNKNYIGELFALYLFYCKGLVESSGLPKCPEAEAWSDSNSSDRHWRVCL